MFYITESLTCEIERNPKLSLINWFMFKPAIDDKNIN